MFLQWLNSNGSYRAWTALCPQVHDLSVASENPGAVSRVQPPWEAGLSLLIIHTPALPCGTSVRGSHSAYFKTGTHLRTSAWSRIGPWKVFKMVTRISIPKFVIVVVTTKE
jgi:hypothetical protein